MKKPASTDCNRISMDTLLLHFDDIELDNGAVLFRSFQFDYSI